jgi:hypothetical protein
MFNRRGELGDQLRIFRLMVLFVIVGGGIVAGVFFVFGGEYDFRGVEAGLLVDKVSECLLEKGIGFLDMNDKKKFYEVCGLNEGFLDNELKLRIQEVDGKIIFQDGSDFESCLFDKKSKSVAECRIGIVSVEGERHEIVAGSNQKIERVVLGGSSDE